MADVWAGLSPPYATIVADPPWPLTESWPLGWVESVGARPRKPLGYSVLPIADIAALPVCDLAAADGWLYLWTINRYVVEAYEVCAAWGYAPSQLLTWCKPPRGIGPGGAFAQTTEHVLLGRRGHPKPLRRMPSTWHVWSRTPHSVKPAAFYDLVEQVSPGPYVDLFCRQPRFGWDSWGRGYELSASAAQDGTVV